MRRLIQIGTAIGSFGLLLLSYGTKISNYLGIFSLPEDLRKAFIAMSEIPTLLASGILIVGLAAIGFLIYDTVPTAFAANGRRKMALWFGLGLGVVLIIACGGALLWPSQKQAELPGSTPVKGVPAGKPILPTKMDTAPPQGTPSAKEELAAGPPDRAKPKPESSVPSQNDQHTIEWMPLFFGWNETDEGDLLVSVIMAGGTNRSSEPFTNLFAYVTPYNTRDRAPMMILGARGEWLDPAKTYGIPPNSDFRFFMKIPPSDPKYTQGVSPDEYLAKYGGYKFEMEYNNGGVTHHETREFSFTEVKELILKENEIRLARKREKNRPGIRSKE